MKKQILRAAIAVAAALIIGACSSPTSSSKGNDTSGNHTVTFDLNYSGSTGAPDAQTIASGGTATQPTAPTRTDFIFSGWSTDTAGTSAFDFSTAITADTTLYAKWSANGVFTAGVGVPFSSSIFGAQGATTTSTPTYNADGSVTYTAQYQFGGGGMAFSFNTGNTAVNLSTYSKIVVSYSVAPSNTSVSNKFVLKAWTSYATSNTFFSNNSNLSFFQLDPPIPSSVQTQTINLTGSSPSAVGVGLCLNDNGYVGASPDGSGDTSGPIDTVAITIYSISVQQ